MCVCEFFIFEVVSRFRSIYVFVARFARIHKAFVLKLRYTGVMSGEGSRNKEQVIKSDTKAMRSKGADGTLLQWGIRIQEQ